MEQKKPHIHFGLDTFTLTMAGIGPLYWILSSFTNAFLFKEGNFLQQLFYPKPLELFVRVFVIWMTVVFSMLFKGYRKLEQRLKDQEEKYASFASLVSAQDPAGLRAKPETLTQKLKDQEALLEDRVAMRTRELESLNDSLQQKLKAQEIEWERKITERTKELHAVRESLTQDLRERDTQIQALTLKDGTKQLEELRQLNESLKNEMKARDEQRETVTKEGIAQRTLALESMNESLQKKLKELEVSIEQKVLEKAAELKSLNESWKQRLQEQEALLTRKDEELATFNDSFKRQIREREKEIQAFREQEQRAREAADDRNTQEQLKNAYEHLQQVQSQFAQLNKMASLGRLTNSVANEINSLLSNMLNNARLTKIKVLQEKNTGFEGVGKLLDATEDLIVKCRNVIRSLLDFSQPPTGLLQPVSLNEAVEKAALLMEHEMKTRNILIKKQLQQDLPQVMGDANLLQQVVVSIIANAAWAIAKKSAPGTGSVAIITEYQPQDARVLVTISDSGIGITKENLGRIFEPLFSTKPLEERIGLSLSVAQEVIKQHKGSVEVESIEGEGTTFKIHMPACLQKTESGVS